jgi:hypothetical protein
MTPASTKPPVSGKEPMNPAGGSAAQGSRFQSQMPQIPGVIQGAPVNQQSKPNRTWIFVAAGVAFLIICIAAWRILKSSHGPTATVTEELTPSPAPEELPPPPPPAAPARSAANEIGTVAELSQPWSSKKFRFTNSSTRESAFAIVIRLPNGNGHVAASYWGIQLKAPYGQCNLEYIADLNEISAKYGYHASHPMVVEPCSNTVYDPLKTGTLTNGSWARGEIVQGAGFRPPMQIEILIQGEKLIAGRAED